MTHAMVLLPDPTAEGWLDRTIAGENVRAAAQLLGGPFRAVAFSTAADSSALQSVNGVLCPECVLYVLTEILAVVSHVRPAAGDTVLLATVAVAPGQRRDFAAHLQSLPEPEEGVKVAAMHAFGPPGVEAVVEVVARDVEAAAAQLLAMLDTDLVDSYDTHYVTPERTRGFGGQAGP